jgi:hypothetical protein
MIMIMIYFFVIEHVSPALVRRSGARVMDEVDYSQYRSPIHEKVKKEDVRRLERKRLRCMRGVPDWNRKKNWLKSRRY